MTEALNMRLIAHDDLSGFGNLGEGISLQVTATGRRILWLAHESAPKNFTAIEVTDPEHPRLIVQTELPHRMVRSNSLDVTGDVMAVAFEVSTPGERPAGLTLYDVSRPETPREIAFFDCAGPHSRGVHQLWFADGKTIHCAAGSADFVPRNPLDDQFYRAIDVSDAARPREIGRWWYPGTSASDPEPCPSRHLRSFAIGDAGYRAHNTNVYPERPDRAYIGYLDGGAVILDIADIGRPKMVAHWNSHPPFPGFTHTVLPLFDRELLLVACESVHDNARDWPKLVWVVDARREENLVPIATLPLPPLEEHAFRGGRFGAHNLHENRPGPSYHSERMVIGAYFNGGVRVHDLANPFQPREIAYFVPDPPPRSKAGAIQINDVYVDENRIVYAVDRFAGGLYVLEMSI